VLEKIALLQRLDRLIVDRRGEMEITGIVAVLQAAVDDPALQFGIVVDRGDEFPDFPVPVLGGSIGKPVLDHEMLHGWLPDPLAPG
jgi:hypothetical protein